MRNKLEMFKKKRMVTEIKEDCVNSRKRDKKITDMKTAMRNDEWIESSLSFTKNCKRRKWRKQ